MIGARVRPSKFSRRQETKTEIFIRTMIFLQKHIGETKNGIVTGNYISVRGDKEWYQHGKRHRDNGPAVVRKDGVCSWCRHGLHLETCICVICFFKWNFIYLFDTISLHHYLREENIIFSSFSIPYAAVKTFLMKNITWFYFILLELFHCSRNVLLDW